MLGAIRHAVETTATRPFGELVLDFPPDEWEQIAAEVASIRRYDSGWTGDCATFVMRVWAGDIRCRLAPSVP